MAQSRFLQSSFASGELSPFLKGRTDLDQYYLGCETAENVTVVPQGGLKRRSGTKLIPYHPISTTRATETPAMPKGGSGSTINDENTTAVTATTIGIGSTDPYVVAQYDFGSATKFNYVDVYAIKKVQSSGTAPTGDLTGKIQVSANNVSWTDAASFAVKLDATTHHIKVGDTVDGLNYRYVRLAMTGVSGSSANSNSLIELAEFNIHKKGTALNPPKLLSLPITLEHNYLVSIHNGRLEIYHSNLEFIDDNLVDPYFVATMPSPYTGAQAQSIKALSYQNVLILLHKDFAPRRLIINDFTSNTPTDIVYEDITFVNAPRYFYNDSTSPTGSNSTQDMILKGHSNNTLLVGDRFQIEIDGIVSKSITFAGDDAEGKAATIENIRRNLQEMPLWGSSGITVAYKGTVSHGFEYTITIAPEAGGGFEEFVGYFVTGNADERFVEFTRTANGTSKEEDLYSGTRGYPTAGAFHNGRLWLSGSPAAPHTLVASKPSQFFDFERKGGEDDEGILITLQSRSASAIHEIVSQRSRLQVFTSGTEYLVSGTTPSTVSASEQTHLGSVNTQTVNTDGSTLFLEANSQALRQYIYNYNEDGFVANNLSTLSSHLVNNATEIASLSGTRTEESNFVFVNNINNIGVLNTLRSQDINGWTKFTFPTGYIVTSMTTLDKRLYFALKKGNQHFVCYTSETESSDVLETKLGVFVNNPSTIYGFTNKANENVDIYINGVYTNTKLVNSVGGIFIDGSDMSFPATVNISVGNGFTSKVKTMPLNTNSGSGGNALREKRINRLNVRVHDSAQVKVDGVQTGILNEATGVVDTSTTNLSGVIMDDSGGKGWGITVNPEITQNRPYGFHIQSIEYEVESS